MNWKKTGVLGILALMMLPLFLSFVAAEVPAPLQKFFDWTSPYLTAAGGETTWTNWIIGAIALILIFAILLDVAGIALPFSTWVNYLIAIGFSAVALMLGIVRYVAALGVSAGAAIAGGAGAVALVISGIMFAAVIIGLFWANSFLGRYVSAMKRGRKTRKSEAAAYEEAMKMRKGKIELTEIGKPAG